MATTAPKTVTIATVACIPVPMRAAMASKVHHVELRHESVPDHGLETFTLSPREFFFGTQLFFPQIMDLGENGAANVRMKAQQLPILINNATTGHKLQGATIASLFVHCWRYEKNWPYVVLSRVKTLKGLYLRKPLTKDPKKYAVPIGYRKLMSAMKDRRPEYWSRDQYAEKFIHSR